MMTPYMGKLYTEDEITEVLENYNNKITFKKCKNVYEAAAISITKNLIIGWFQDRSECGPRALGNRSIIVDPRKASMKDYLNERVKFREGFRPYAPAILWEYQKEYFDLDIPSPYMLMVADILPEKRSIIPAVTHVDGTGRIQTVMRELNYKFYNLIEAFYLITGVPVLLNTSFNVQGEPIVESPEDAIKCFLKTNIDELYIHNYIIKKI